jgi:hypothetical protein
VELEDDEDEEDEEDDEDEEDEEDDTDDDQLPLLDDDDDDDEEDNATLWTTHHVTRLSNCNLILGIVYGFTGSTYIHTDSHLDHVVLDIYVQPLQS